jgi:GNAT superfamily N-acetyltransferase
MTFRHTVKKPDIKKVRKILESTKFFHTAEIKIAEDLVLDGTIPGSDYHFFFAEIDKKVVGFTCYGPIACTLSSFDLYWIAVSSLVQGQGIGRDILKVTENAIKKLGGTRIYIETSAKDLYKPTRGFYIAQGYAEASILKDFYAPGDDKITYVKVLE